MKTGHGQCLIVEIYNQSTYQKKPSARDSYAAAGMGMRKRVGLQRMQISRSYLIRVLQTARGCQFVGREWRKTESCQWRRGEALYASRRSSDQFKIINKCLMTFFPLNKDSCAVLKCGSPAKKFVKIYSYYFK